MKRSVVVLIAVLLAATVASSAETKATTQAKPKPKIDIGNVRVADSKGDQLTVDLTWSYIEQENLARPTEFNIIAILIGLHQEKFTARLRVPVPASGPIPLSAKVAIVHNQPIVSPRDLEVTVTVAPKIPGITDGTSNTVVAKKVAVLHVEP